jgi:hypothetical protein
MAKNQTVNNMLSTTCHKTDVTKAAIMIVASAEEGNPLNNEFTVSKKIV